MSETTATVPPPAAPASGPPEPGGGGPLLRNAYALMLNTGVSALLGLGYWLAAARHYSEEAVGQGSAAIAAMKLLAGLTAVTLTGALARFLPVAGRATGSLVLRTYTGGALVVAAAAAGFLLTLGWWGPSYRFLAEPLAGAGFVVAVVAWALLTLQDGVLTGLRGAVWVPVGNTVFSAVKLALLVVLATALPATGVFVSWTVATAFSVLPLGWLVFRRLVPRHTAATGDRARPPSAREIGRFLAGDSTGSLFSLAVVFLVPVIIAARIDPADNAHYYVAATIGGTVGLLAVNMGASLTVEGAHDPARLAAHTRAALRRMTRIMLPVCTALFLGAPYALGVFGGGYADAATALLRWLAVGALLRVVVETYFAVLRARSRTAPLAWLQGLLCALVLGLTLLLLPRAGLTAAGIAEVTALGVVVLIAAPRLYRVVRGAPDGGRGGGATGVAAADVAPDGDLSDLGVPALVAHRGPPGPDGRRVRRPSWARPPAPVPPPPSPGGGTGTDGGGRRGAGRAVSALTVALLLLALGLYWLPALRLDERDLDRMGGLGLVEVLPPPVLAGAALLAVVFGGLLGRRREHRFPLALTLAATVVSLHALPAVLEDEPRFATAYQHLGFLDHLDRTGTAAPDLDARWSWPGFFAGAAFLARAAGAGDLTEVIRWWPTVLQLLCLVPVFMIARTLRASWRARWAGVWIFALGSWVGQDYFSPQGFTHLLYLVFAAVLLRWFRLRAPADGTDGARGPDGRGPGTGVRDGPTPVPEAPGGRAADVKAPGGRVPGGLEATPATRGQRGALLAVLVLLFAAAVSAHQLTPFVMLGVLTALVLVDRGELRGLPLLFGVMALAWIGFLAEPYWSGHFDELFGGVGGVGSNVTSSVSGRIEGGSDTHRLVLYARVALAGSVLLLGCAGWLRRHRAGYAERALPVLAFVPFLGFGMQSYGGEMALRVFMFALPGAALLAGLALFPRTDPSPARPDGPARPGGPAPRTARRPRRAALAALLVGTVLLGGFLVARWGNEPFERVRPGEVTAMEYVYAHDEPTARLLWLSDDPVVNVTPALPWGARDMARVTYVPVLAPVDPERTAGLVSALRKAGPRSYLMVGASQSVSLRLDAGYPAGWDARLRANLDERPELRRVFAHRDAVVYALRKPPPGPVARPDPGPPGPRVTWTPWSVAGGWAALALIVLLGGGEAVRVGVRPGARRTRLLRIALGCALPPGVVLAVSLAHRFTTLA
ncbi:lipopolysaccharide biosynthesis protein [Streptomyces sp. JNUCC 64]